ncbi:F-box/LRR-repeat protein [Trifolium repens]|nr:F-box/LRR-repeat protein [Trifolium repens]
MAAAAAKRCSYLPEELWECIVKFLDRDDDHRTLMSLSVVSNRLLSITNRLRSSLTITNQTIPFLPRVFHRFPNITSLNLASFSNITNDALLCQISTLPLDIKSLNISSTAAMPISGLQALSNKMKNLISLTCSNINYLNIDDLFVIADCFPLLEELNLSLSTSLSTSYPTPTHDFVLNNHHQLVLPLPKLREINLSGDKVHCGFLIFIWQIKSGA